MRLSILLVLSLVPLNYLLHRAQLAHLLCYRISKRIHITAARITRALPDNLTATEVLQRAHWQPVNYFYKWKLAALMYSTYYNLAPEPICELLSPGTKHSCKAEEIAATRSLNAQLFFVHHTTY